MAVPIIVAQINEVLAGTYSSTTFMDTSSSICQSLLQDAVIAINAIPLDSRLETLVSSGFITLLLDLFKIDLKPINDTTVRLKCLSLGTLTQLLEEISSGENTSYVRVQTAVLKTFVAMGGLEELAKALSNPKVETTQLVDYSIQFLKQLIQVRFGIICLFRELHNSVPILKLFLDRLATNSHTFNEMLSLLSVYTTTSFSTDEFLLFLSANTHEFLLRRALPISFSSQSITDIEVSNSTRLAGLNLLSDFLERLYTFKQSTAKAMLTTDRPDKAMGHYNELLRYQDKIFSEMAINDYIITNIISGSDGRMPQTIDSVTFKSPVQSRHLALSTTVPRLRTENCSGSLHRSDAITTRFLCLFFLHCGERRIEAYTRIPFSLFEIRGGFAHHLPMLSVQEEQIIVEYLFNIYSIRTFRAITLFFYSYLSSGYKDQQQYNIAYSYEDVDIIESYFRIILLFLVYSPYSFKQTLVDAALLEYNALQFETSTSQNIRLSATSGSSGMRRTLVSTFFVPLIQNILTPFTQFPTIPAYAATAFSLLCISVGGTSDYTNLWSILHIVAEYLALESQSVEEIILEKITNCFISDSLDFLQELYIFVDVKSSLQLSETECISTVSSPINYKIILLNSGYNALGVALHVAQCVSDDISTSTGCSLSSKSKTLSSSVVVQNQRVTRMNTNLMALYSSAASLKLFSGEKELSLVSSQSYSTLLDCLVDLFEDSSQSSQETNYKIFQEYESYIIPNTIYTLYRRQDILLLLQSINSPNVTLICRNTRAFLIQSVVFLLHNIQPTAESINVSTITDAISRYIIELSDSLDFEMLATTHKKQTTLTLLCGIDKVTFCRAILILLCNPYILLSTGEHNINQLLNELSQKDGNYVHRVTNTISQLNALLCREILYKSVHTFFNFYTTSGTKKIVDLPQALLINVATDIRRLREIDNLKRIHSTSDQEGNFVMSTDSFAQHFNNAAEYSTIASDLNFSSLMLQLCDYYGNKLVSIEAQPYSLNATAQKRGTKLLKHALIIARSLDSDMTYMNSRTESITSQSYSILSTSTSLAQVSRLHSNKIKRKLLLHMLQVDKITSETLITFADKKDLLSPNGFNINTAYCLRYAHNTLEKTVMQQVETLYTKNPTIFMVSSKFSQIQTLKSEYNVSLPSFRLQLSDLLDITAWLLQIVTYDYNLRVPEILYSLNLTETGAMPFSSDFVTELFPTYANSTLELAIQATTKAREDNDRKLHSINNTKNHNKDILEIIYRRIAIKICDAVLESLYKLRLMFFGLYGSKILFNVETSNFNTDFQRIPEQNGYGGIYTRDVDNKNTASAMPYKGLLPAYYFSETNAEVSRLTSVALVALMLTFMQSRKNTSTILEPSRPTLEISTITSPRFLQQPDSEEHIEVNLAAASLSPLQTIAFVEMLQESLRYGFVMDNNIRYLQLNARFDNCIFGNSETNVSINAHMPRVQAFLRKYSNYNFAVPTVTDEGDAITVRSSLLNEVFSVGHCSRLYASTKDKNNIAIDDPRNYRNSSRIMNALFNEEGSSTQDLTTTMTATDQSTKIEVQSPPSTASRRSIPSRLVAAVIDGSDTRSETPIQDVKSEEFVYKQHRVTNLNISEHDFKEEQEDDTFHLEEVLRVASEYTDNVIGSTDPHSHPSHNSDTGSTPVPQLIISATNTETHRTAIDAVQTQSPTPITQKHRAPSIPKAGGISKPVAVAKKRHVPLPPMAAKSPPSENATYIEKISTSLMEKQSCGISITPELSSSKLDVLMPSASEDTDAPEVMKLLTGKKNFKSSEILNKEVSKIEESLGTINSEGIPNHGELNTIMTSVDKNTLTSLIDELGADIQQVISKHNANKKASPVIELKDRHDFCDEKEALPILQTLSDDTLNKIIDSLEDISKAVPPPPFS